MAEKLKQNRAGFQISHDGTISHAQVFCKCQKAKYLGCLEQGYYGENAKKKQIAEMELEAKRVGWLVDGIIICPTCQLQSRHGTGGPNEVFRNRLWAFKLRHKNRRSSRNYPTGVTVESIARQSLPKSN